MSIQKGRNIRLKLYIPPEASNIIHDGDKEQNDKIGVQRISIAKEKRIPALTRLLEPSFYESFYFLHIAAPVESKSCVESDNHSSLKSLISRINKMNPPPKFIVFCGGFMEVGVNRSDRNLSKKDSIEETLEGLDSKIRVVCVPTVDDFRNKANIEGVEDYRSVYGDDWYGFWVCGVSFMTINSLYYQQGMDSSLEALKTEQDDWMDSELLQQQVFCAQWTVIFQDSLVPNKEGDNLGKGQNIGLLNKYTQAGATHVFCRQLDETLTSHHNCDSMEIVGHSSNKLPNKDWGIILVRVTRDKVEHTSFPLNELPETVDL